MLKRVHGSARLTSMAGRYIEKANPTSEDGKKMAEASQLSVRRVNATRALRARTPGMNLTDRFDSAQLLTGQWTSSFLEARASSTRHPTLLPRSPYHNLELAYHL